MCADAAPPKDHDPGRKNRHSPRLQNSADEAIKGVYGLRDNKEVYAGVGSCERAMQLLDELVELDNSELTTVLCEKSRVGPGRRYGPVPADNFDLPSDPQGSSCMLFESI